MSKDREKRLLEQQTSDDVRLGYRQQKTLAAATAGRLFVAVLAEMYDEDLAGYTKHSEMAVDLVEHLEKKEEKLTRERHERASRERFASDLM